MTMIPVFQEYPFRLLPILPGQGSAAERVVLSRSMAYERKLKWLPGINFQPSLHKWKKLPIYSSDWRFHG